MIVQLLSRPLFLGRPCCGPQIAINLGPVRRWRDRADPLPVALRRWALLDGRFPEDLSYFVVPADRGTLTMLPCSLRRISLFGNLKFPVLQRLADQQEAQFSQ